jgi:hypothetical protein
VASLIVSFEPQLFLYFLPLFSILFTFSLHNQYEMIRIPYQVTIPTEYFPKDLLDNIPEDRDYDSDEEDSPENNSTNTDLGSSYG